MPDIKLDYLVSVSSEDPHHPASNLLKSQSYKKWKCAKAGESQVSVIFQLEKATLINTIDIGNESSAFIEVLVGKSSAPNEPYQVLLMSSSFMTPADSRTSTNLNRVRMFTQDKLCGDMVKQQWDRVKVVCTQPFASHLQYGLSFIRLHSPSETEASTALSSSLSGVRLGRFTLKPEENDDIGAGTLFARRKELKDEASPAKPRTAAAAISEASSPSSLSAAGPSSKTKAAKIVPKKREHSTGHTDSPNTKRKANGNHTPTSSKNKDDGGQDKDKSPVRFVANNRKALERDTPSPVLPEPSPSPPLPEIPKQQKRLPFGELLKGVVIVLSGFQNPLRGTLRQKASEMGAKYQADWNNICTHLICAFPNTPKARQVRGQGKIVTKDWVEQCHMQRKKLPWRRFALDSKEKDESDTEEEVWEEIKVPPKAAKASPAQAIKPAVTAISSPVAATFTTVSEDVQAKSPEDLNVYDGETDDEMEVTAVEAPSNSQSKPSPPKETKSIQDPIYDADTDVDSDGEQLPSLPPLPDFFDGISFTLHEELSSEDKKQLRRYIAAFKGKIVEDLNESVKYLITETSEGLPELRAFYPNVEPVKPQWVWDCNDASKVLPIEKYQLS